ncbi:putative choline kinase [Aspergillus campestris IBT 28561]|uniref:Choline kinase n=1 Tax=Aspergillus campestris (strain IBT 28561) TaxID=1392248 RepID=A0A2I1DH43_ASPC2|nr:putative choline kinase [Aspergillus campestris IBT 28561]PKY09190.1 putative choline kinase [Aspergillus campestris IBT 28561]
MDSDPSSKGLQPILGTGLSVPFPKVRPAANGNGTPAVAPDHALPRRHRTSISMRPASRSHRHTVSMSSQTSSTFNEPLTREDREKNGEDDIQYNLFSQVYEWLQREKYKQKSRGAAQTDGPGSDGDDDDEDTPAAPSREPPSHDAAPPLALENLEKILLQYATHGMPPARRPGRRRKGLRRGSVSDSDCTDVEAAPPAVDAVLDNSKTLAYTGGGAEEEDGEDGELSRKASDREAWMVFKSEILRITQTLRLRGWRKLPADLAGDIEVVRLSGALTNAVYVVNPPQNIPPPKAEDGSYTLVPAKRPAKLLLRIYGPQVDHLIDREKELQILRRLGRKNIGPKVLGTFKNGRFEEYFEARTLTPPDLRDPATMVQIAKRMRELHEGVELLEDEREGGPMVFKNWDKWVDRCEQVINWLDKEIRSRHNEAKSASEPWRRRGFVCGVPWTTFRKAVDNYRQWLVTSCGGGTEIEQNLVFAHNDTQYGNLLRLEPASESPLLRPENEHKQLVVIDFEYASANTPGFEFANHFSEWCYNYHDPERSWACNTKAFPTPEQQRRFITAYLTHRPGMKGPSSSPSITPLMRGMASAHMSTLAPLDLDTPDADPQAAADTVRAHEDSMETKIQSLMHQTRLWRVFNSAQWVAWGIVQAKVDGMEEGIAADAVSSGLSSPTESPANRNHSRTPSVDSTAADDEEDEFDYLAYSQDRAMFFWADLLEMNLIREDELPAETVEKAKARMTGY